MGQCVYFPSGSLFLYPLWNMVFTSSFAKKADSTTAKKIRGCLEDPMDTEVFPLLLPKDAVVPWTQIAIMLRWSGRSTTQEWPFSLPIQKSLAN